MKLVARLRSWFTRTPRPQTLGQRGEAEAAKLLKSKGYQIVERSSRGPLGEIDLIAVDDGTVVFVEVKTRSTHDAGHPADAVDENKQRRLTRLALMYLKQHGLLDNPARFDVVAITWPNAAESPRIEHFRGAFEAVGRWQMFG